MNKSGMSMLGVLIATALLGVLAMMVAQLMEQGSKAVKSTEVNMDVLGFRNVLTDLLRDRNACTTTFGRLNSSTANLNLVPPDNDPFSRRGFSFDDDANVIADNQPGPAPDGLFDGNDSIEWQTGEKVIGGLRLNSVIIPENVENPNGSGTIPNFRSLSGDTGWFEIYVDVEKTGTKAKIYGGKIRRLTLVLSADTYMDAGVRRIKWCQLAGSTTIPASAATGTIHLCRNDLTAVTGLDLACQIAADNTDDNPSNNNYTTPYMPLGCVYTWSGNTGQDWSTGRYSRYDTATSSWKLVHNTTAYNCVNGTTMVLGP